MVKPKLHFQRFEFKYYLPKNTADKLIPTLLNYMNWDSYIQNTGRDYYEVNSLYFDTYNFDCFWDKEAGVSNRKKLRFRFYGHDLLPETLVFLEIKQKNNVLVTKDRVKLKMSDCVNENLDSALMSNYGNNNDKFLDSLFLFKNTNFLKPKLYISYKRKALVGKHDDRFRVTFDYDIKTKLSSDIKDGTSSLKDVYFDGVVLELKYNNILPSWFHGIIQSYQLDRIAYSKYCNSLRMCLPNLDDNNYSLR